jgi:hypothetical protein
VHIDHDYHMQGGTDKQITEIVRLLKLVLRSADHDQGL